jgi:hypothetical protein
MPPALPSLKGVFPQRYFGNAWAPHLPFGYDLVSELKPPILVELGAHFGESYFNFCQAVRECGLATVCYAVDTWKGDKHTGAYDESVFAEFERQNSAEYSAFSYLLRTTFDEAASQFADGTIGLLHIDGLHTYEAVRHDFETWLPKVREDGIVLFHDVVVRHGDFGVWRLWEELQQDFATFQFSQGYGLGVLKARREARLASPFLEALFACTPEEAHRLRCYYRLCQERLRFKAESVFASNEAVRLREALERSQQASGEPWPRIR